MIYTGEFFKTSIKLSFLCEATDAESKFEKVSLF